jgi:predicted  nucleic acid-binding Zn-ribbon protein
MSWVDLLAAIPATVWGVLIGSLLTFLGVGRQLRHDARQRDRERQMHWRRDVYLEAAEGVAGTSDQFFRLANAEIPLSQFATTPSKPGWLNKILTVASLDTIAAFTEANASLAAAMFDLLKLRLGVDELTGEISTMQAQIESIRAFQQKLQADVSAVAAQPASPAVTQRLEYIKSYWDKSWIDLSEGTNRLSELTDKKWRLARGLLEQGVNYYLGYQKKLHKALLALRRELELPIDPAAYESVFERTDAEVLPKFNQLLASLDQEEPSSK